MQLGLPLFVRRASFGREGIGATGHRKLARPRCPAQELDAARDTDNLESIGNGLAPKGSRRARVERVAERIVVGEVAPHESFVHDDRTWMARIVGKKAPPEDGLDAEHVEIARAHTGAEQELRLTLARPREPSRAENGHVREHRALRLPVEVILEVARDLFMRPASSGAYSHSERSCSGFSKSRGFSKTPCTMLKIAVLAPMPRASVSTTMAVKPGVLMRLRKPKRRSRAKDCMLLLASLDEKNRRRVCSNFSWARSREGLVRQGRRRASPPSAARCGR